MDTQLTQRYAANLHGVLSCYDRILITGTLPGACYANGMTSFLYSRGIRIFDYAKHFEPLRERIRARAVKVCASVTTQGGVSPSKTRIKMHYANRGRVGAPSNVCTSASNRFSPCLCSVAR